MSGNDYNQYQAGTQGKARARALSPGVLPVKLQQYVLLHGNLPQTPKR